MTTGRISAILCRENVSRYRLTPFLRPSGRHLIHRSALVPVSAGQDARVSAIRAVPPSARTVLVPGQLPELERSDPSKLGENPSQITKVSVIVPTCNRVDRLGRVMGALAAQTVDPADFEVIVVSDGSTDGTDEFLRQVVTPFRLRGTSQANAGPAAARNTGVRLAAGDVLLFVDDDVVPQRDLIEQHVATHGQAKAEVVVIGPMLTPADYHPNAFVRWEQAMLYRQYSAMIRGHYEPTYRQFYTGNASVRREFLLASGGFDERFRRAEDVELACRLRDNGARFIFSPQAVGYHYAERSFSSWIQNARDYGRNEVLFDRYYGRLSRLQDVRSEFMRRHAALRSVTRRCVGRPRLEAAIQVMGRAVAATAGSLGQERLVRIGLSAIYHTAYYSGLAEELGGRRAFSQFIADVRVPESLAGAWACGPETIEVFDRPHEPHCSQRLGTGRAEVAVPAGGVSEKRIEDRAQAWSKPLYR